MLYSTLDETVKLDRNWLSSSAETWRGVAPVDHVCSSASFCWSMGGSHAYRPFDKAPHEHSPVSDSAEAEDHHHTYLPLLAKSPPGSLSSHRQFLSLLTRVAGGEDACVRPRWWHQYELWRISKACSCNEPVCVMMRLLFHHFSTTH